MSTPQRMTNPHQPAHRITEETNTFMTTQREPVKLLLTVTEAAARLGIGRTLMYELISTGQLKSVLVGRLRRIRPADLESYATNLSPDQQPTHAA